MTTKPEPALIAAIARFNHYAILSLLPVALLLLQAGCASRPVQTFEPWSMPGPGKPLGKIAVAPSGILPPFDLQVPDSRSEAANDYGGQLAGPWIRRWIDGEFINGLDAIVSTASLAFTPLLYLAGAAYGAPQGESAARRDAALLVLTNATAQLQVDRGSRALVLTLLEQNTGHPVIILSNLLTEPKRFRRASLMDEVAPLPIYDPDCARPNEPLVAYSQCNTLVLIRTVHHGLAGKHGPNSPLVFHAGLHVTFVDTSNNRSLHEFYAEYESAAYRFVDWAGDNGRLFREEYLRAMEDLAGQIARQFPAASTPFLAGHP